MSWERLWKMTSPSHPTPAKIFAPLRKRVPGEIDCQNLATDMTYLGWLGLPREVSYVTATSMRAL